MNQTKEKPEHGVIAEQEKSVQSERPHEGHRQRLRKKWDDGVRLEKHEFLELLLFYPIARKNTNEIAHHLLNRFGSFQALLDASEEELLRVPGVGKETVRFLGMLAELVARYQEERVNKNYAFRSYSELCAYLSTLFIGESKEQVYLLLFNNSGRLLLTEKVGDGFAALSEVSLRRINQLAVSFSATSAVLAHNHPNGLREPSVQDVQTTKQIFQALDLLGVNLMDHIVVTRDSYVSILHRAERVFDKERDLHKDFI